MADYDISEAFQRIEEEMIASMSRNLRRHLKKEKSEGINYSMWQAEQLAALTNFRKNNAKAFQSYFSTINGQIETILKMAHTSGAMDQETRILEAIKKGWKVNGLPTTDALQGAFFQINERKLNALIEATVKDMEKAEAAMLRMANDEYRKTIYNAEVYYNTGAGTLSQCVDMATKDFLAKGIACIEYANGARVGIDSYAQMALRTAQTRAYLAGEASMRDEWGVSTVIVNKRGVACPRCLRWVGRVYYDDVWGSAPIPSPQKYPLLSEAMAGGLYHPNCRDIHTTYFEGVNTPPEPMTAAEKQEAARVYNLEQQQRYNERQIRKYKRLSAGSVDPENQAEYQAKLAAWQKRQREFVKANGDVLRRRYENEKLRVPSTFPEPPKTTFTPAKTKEEAVEYARRFADVVDYDGISLENCNAINEQLTILTEKYPCHRYEKIVQQQMKAVASANFRTLTINGKKIGSDNVGEMFTQLRAADEITLQTIRKRYPSGRYPSAIQKQIKRLEHNLRFNRWSVSYTHGVHGTIAHEFGHTLADQYIGMINDITANANARSIVCQNARKLITETRNRAFDSGDIYLISKYGATDDDEFFAETFAMREMGESIPDYIANMLDEVLKIGIM